MNGKLARSGILQGPVETNPSVTDQIHIGREDDDNPGYDGWMSCLKIYDYSLTANDIYKLYSKGPSGCGKATLKDTPIDKYRFEAGITNLNNNNDHTISLNL